MPYTHLRPFAFLTCACLLASALLLESCDKNELKNASVRKPVLPASAYDYDSDVQHAKAVVQPFSHDSIEINNDLATLGRVLFYDPALSLNNRTSCASCHKQSRAFADPAQFSEGFVNGETKRNSLGIQNLFSRSDASGFFWDGRAETLEKQVLMPIRDHVEMGMRSTDELVVKLQAMDYYQPLFENAYGSDKVTESRIAEALTHFVKAIPSYRSKYDQGRDTERSNLSVQERRGFELFFRELPCGSCHLDGNFENYAHTSIGLDVEYADKGRGEWDLGLGTMAYGLFLTPTLRNIALTAPYMHDGRFQTLEEVIEFYNSGIQPHPNLDYRLRDLSGTFTDDLINPGTQGSGAPLRMNLTENDKQALVAFLKTLTDQELLSDPKYSDPFVTIEE